jgi:hypothetical protein
MKNVIKVGVSLALMGVLGIAASHARADADHPAAITLKDKEHPVGCRAFGLQTSDKIHTVSTPSGNTKLTCHFNVPEGQRPPSTQEKNGFACGIFLPNGATKITNDSSFQKTPGGQAKLECTVKM